MKAAILGAHGAIEGNPLVVRDVEKPEPGRGQLLVKVRACGVCRSNLHMIEGDWPGVPTKFPIVPGHEVVGTVDQLGPSVENFQVGDRVGVQPLWSTCGKCEFCLTGRDPLCQSKEITGETVDGGYAEYMVATAAHTYQLPDALGGAAEAAPLFCPGITAYGAVAKAGLTPAKRAAVFGIGGVGHMTLQFANLYGGEVIAVSRGADHLDLANELGAAWTVDATKDDPGEVLSRQGGVDAAFVFAPSDTTMRQALDAVKPGGMVIVGVNVNVGALPFATEKVVVGSLLGSRQQMEEVLAIAAAGKVQVVAEAFELDRANELLQRLKRGEIRGRATLVI
jgi:propanol-preferring alcohol dehydrogenase